MRFIMRFSTIASLLSLSFTNGHTVHTSDTLLVAEEIEQDEIVTQYNGIRSIPKDQRNLERRWQQRNNDINLQDSEYGNANGNNRDSIGTQVILTKDGKRVAIEATRPAVTANKFWAFYEDVPANRAFEYASQPMFDVQTKVVPAGTSFSMTSDGKSFASSESRCDFGNSKVDYVPNSICIQTSSKQGPDMTKLIGSERGSGTTWGKSVSLTSNGNYVAVGTSDGSVYVYEVSRLLSNNNLDDARYGSQIDISSNQKTLGEVVKMAGNESSLRVAVGGKSENNNGAKIRVYSYNLNQKSWGQIGRDINAGSDGTRFEISKNGNVIAVVLGQNEVEVFEYDSVDVDWVKRGRTLSVANNHYASISLDDSGDFLAVGTYRGGLSGGTDANKVEVYKYIKDDWNVISTQPVENSNKGSVDFGSSVSLSADGFVIAVAAPAFSTAEQSKGFVAVYDTDRTPSTIPTQAPIKSVPSPRKYRCNEVIARIPPSEVLTILNTFVTNIRSISTDLLSQFRDELQYGVQVKTVCAACSNIKTSLKDSKNADYRKYCGKGAYGYDDQQSGLVMVPLVVDEDDSTNLVELGGTLAAYIFSRSTKTNQFKVPSQLWSDNDDDHDSLELLLCFLATATSGKVSIAPDFMGYGLSDSQKGYMLRNTYVTSMLPLWKKVGSDISSDTDCKTVVADVAFIGGYAEGGYGAVAIAEGLHRALGIDIVQVRAGGAPLNPEITFLEMIKKFGRGDDISRYWYITVIIGNTYSSKSPSVAQYNTGGQNILKDEYLYTRDWLDESGITHLDINDRISNILTRKGLDGKDLLTELWNPKFMSFMEGAIDAGVDNPCNPSYSGYKVGENDKYCEIMIQSGLIDVLQNAEYPVDLCHGREDELVSYKNVPDISVNPDYLSVSTKDGSHATTYPLCIVEDLSNFISPEFSGYVAESKHNDVGCRTFPPSQLPTSLPTSICLSNCSCRAGSGCDLSACTINCNCPGGGCDMSTCTRDCRCKGGDCNMKRCQSNCKCEGRNCRMDNCLYNGRCASGGSSIRGSTMAVKGSILVTTLMSFFLLAL